MKAEHELKLNELEKLVSGMDVPVFRTRSVGWLNRNLGVRNSHHPDFPKALELIKFLLSQGIAFG